MSGNWQSYDSAAAVHERIGVPSTFAAPARDLVDRVGVPGGATLLDVGTGTGVAALTALEIADSSARIAGVDPSVAMLGVARGKGLERVAAASVPGLPFRSSSFNRVIASFVLNHIGDYPAALADMVRVLRPGGKLGTTTWGSMEIECRARWQAIADSFAGRETLRAAMRESLPSEEWFADPAHLDEAFRDAGLADVDVQRVEYTTRMTVDDFLTLRATTMQARFLRKTLDPEAWERFQQTVYSEFHARYGDTLEYTRDVHIAIGRKL